MLRKRILHSCIWVLFLVSQINLLNCEKTKPINENDKTYIQSIKEWHQNRVESLEKRDGWLSLAGLFWLKPGENTFGAAISNDIIFPKGKAPAEIGSFLLENDRVTVKIRNDITVTNEENPVTEMEMINDMQGEPTLLTYKSLSWYLIKRGDRYGIRLKDSKSEQFKQFKGIDRYKIDPAWRITARFESYDPPHKLSIVNVMGDINEENCPGALLFEIKGKTYRLEPIAYPEDETFFVIIADATTGKETYGGGRFMVVDKPNDDNSTILDFNKAYNPPCVYTPYATCPLPPEQNRLPIKITAGEKYSGHD